VHRTALLLAALLAAVPAHPRAQGERRVLSVAAAASLRGVVDAWRRDFQALHPGVEVSVTLGASGALVTQIRNGAPFDLLLSADGEYPRALVEAGLARAEDERVYGRGRLVAWVPAGSRLDLEGRGLAALSSPTVKRIAIANPSVAPWGRAAESALRAAGVLDAVRGRLVLGTSVAQAAQFATTGAADVALIPLSVTLEPALARGKTIRLPESLAPLVPQSGVVLAAAREPALARAFLDHAAGEAGRAVLERHGYAPP
jgi:molybdate transport system substrate-binding protein